MASKLIRAEDAIAATLLMVEYAIFFRLWDPRKTDDEIVEITKRVYEATPAGGLTQRVPWSTFVGGAVSVPHAVLQTAKMLRQP